MTDDRFREIMTRLGMPDSASLLAALQQVANEVGQEVQKKTAKECADIVGCWRSAPGRHPLLTGVDAAAFIEKKFSL